jgi:Carbamoyltransferase C-terminus
VLVNTSFNVRGEAIACTPEDAFRCLMGTEIEVLGVGDCLLRKERQDPALKLHYLNVSEPGQREWPFRWRRAINPAVGLPEVSSLGAPELC